MKTGQKLTITKDLINMNKQERINYLIKLTKILEPGVLIDKNYMFKGASIEKLAEFDGPGYKRMKGWLEEKVNQIELEAQFKEEIEIEEDKTDMELAKDEFVRCFELMKGRNDKYGDSYKKLRLNSIVDLMYMKLDRCVKQSLDNKAIEVELEDIVNYGIFGLMKIRNEKN